MTPTATERPALPKNLRLTSMLTLILLGLTALAFAVGMPLSLIVLVTAPATIGLAIAALVFSRGVASAGGIRVWLWIAIGVGVMSILAGIGLVLMRGPLEQLEACYARAITPTAQRECEAEYEKSYEELLEKYREYGAVTTQ